MAACPSYISSQNAFRGFAITGGYFHSGELKGVVVAGYANISKTNGASIALYNRTKVLHGIQLGLLNYAGNNSKGLRMLPIINLHLRKSYENKD